MFAYFLRRMLLIPPTFIGITLLVFTITRFVPGGPVEKMIQEIQAKAQEGGRGGGNSNLTIQNLSEDQIQQLKEYYGFDKPILVSYAQWLGKVLTLDLGTSTRYLDPVWDIVKKRFPISIFYGLVSMLLTYIICIPLGILKAIKHQTWFDNVSSVFVFVGYAIPGYVVAVILLTYLASAWEWFPLGGFVSDRFDELTAWEKFVDVWHHAALPLVAYCIGSFAVMTFTMKNSLMENLAADYVRTAMAKGMPFRRAVVRHALRNSLIPIATTFGDNVSLLLAGSFLIEKIFNIDGIGLLGYQSVVERDYPIVMGILVIGALLQLFGNIVSDFCVALVDPRVQFD